jgi:hypothetical protein
MLFIWRRGSVRVTVYRCMCARSWCISTFVTGWSYLTDKKGGLETRNGALVCGLRWHLNRRITCWTGEEKKLNFMEFWQRCGSHGFRISSIARSAWKSTLSTCWFVTVGKNCSYLWVKMCIFGTSGDGYSPETMQPLEIIQYIFSECKWYTGWAKKNYGETYGR